VTAEPPNSAFSQKITRESRRSFLFLFLFLFLAARKEGLHPCCIYAMLRLHGQRWQMHHARSFLLLLPSHRTLGEELGAEDEEPLFLPTPLFMASAEEG
jgi:hypothetical protein